MTAPRDLSLAPASATRISLIKQTREFPTTEYFHRYNSFKTMIASPPDELTIKVKYLRDFKVPILVQVVFLTNYENGVYFEEKDDGRYFVIWSHVERRPDEYYQQLARWIEGHYLDVIAYLARRDLSRFDPKALPPHTKAREAMHKATRSVAENVLADVVGELAARFEAFSVSDIKQRAQELHHKGLEALLDSRVRLGKALKDLGLDSAETRIGGRDVHVYWKREQMSRDEATARFRRRSTPSNGYAGPEGG